MKRVSFDEEALQGMLTGMRTVTEAVSRTLGPCGTNVFVDNATTPRFTNDGARIAHEITLPDPLENAGAWVARNACSQTNDDAGDGTTTTTVLLQSIVDECFKRPENKTVIMHSLMEAKKKVLELLKKQSKTITQKDVINVARISAENEELAQLITEVVKKVGSKAVVTVEDRQDGFESDYKLVQGYEAHVGFMSPYFRNDPTRARAVHTDIYVLCTRRKIGNLNDLVEISKTLEKNKISSLVVVGEEIDEKMVGVFVQTNMTGAMNLLAIKATGPLLEDIAAATGATLIDDGVGITFETMDKSHLGHAAKVICDEKSTVFTSGATSAHKHAKRLEAFAAENPNQFEGKRLKERAQKLKGGIAVIRIGAHTDAERNYLKDKAEDTIHAVQSALEEGVVQGGGISLYRITESLRGTSVGEEILRKSLSAPLKQIVSNAGKEYAGVIKNLPLGKGYNAKTDSYEDFLKTGVLDPTRVERCAIENAVSTAAHFITTHASIVAHVEENKK